MVALRIVVTSTRAGLKTTRQHLGDLVQLLKGGCSLIGIDVMVLMAGIGGGSAAALFSNLNAIQAPQHSLVMIPQGLISVVRGGESILEASVVLVAQAGGHYCHCCSAGGEGRL
jgi:hypothetical protein